MCCGSKSNPPQSKRIKAVSSGETVQMRYLGNDIITTWQTPARHTYRIDIQDPVFTADMVDVKYFVERMERGRPLFAIIPTPQPIAEPQVEIQSVEEPVTQEVVEVAMSVSDEVETLEVAEMQEEADKPSRKRKQK